MLFFIICYIIYLQFIFFPYIQGPYLCSYPMFLVYYTILLVLFIFPFHHPSLITPTPPAPERYLLQLHPAWKVLASSGKFCCPRRKKILSLWRNLRDVKVGNVIFLIRKTGYTKYQILSKSKVQHSNIHFKRHSHLKYWITYF